MGRDISIFFSFTVRSLVLALRGQGTKEGGSDVTMKSWLCTRTTWKGLSSSAEELEGEQNLHPKNQGHKKTGEFSTTLLASSI